MAKDCGRYVVIQMGSGMEERCHSVQGVHWCNKKIAHINTPTRCFYPLKTQTWLPAERKFFGPPPVLNIFQRRPRTHKRHSLIYAHIPSTHTQPQRYTYDWHASHSHVSRTGTKILRSSRQGLHATSGRSACRGAPGMKKIGDCEYTTTLPP